MRLRSLAPLLLLAALACGEDRTRYLEPEHLDAGFLDSGCTSASVDAEAFCGCECHPIGLEFCLDEVRRDDAGTIQSQICECNPHCARFVDAGS